MADRITIERECEHKIIAKQGLIIIVTLTEFISDLCRLGKETKYASVNVSLINDNYGAQIGKISGSGKTGEEAYRNCLDNFNKNINFHAEENKILLCCKNIPLLQPGDLQDFYLTRTIRFSWRYDKNKTGILNAYVRRDGEGLKFTYDGTEECREAESDEQIIGYILSHNTFDIPPQKTSVRRKNRLFYPTINEFLR